MRQTCSKTVGPSFVTVNRMARRLALPISLASRLALNQPQVAQVVAVMLDQVEGVQHRLMAPASGPQRTEVRHPVVASDHRLAIDQERRGFDAEGSINDGREAVGPVRAVASEARTREPSRRTISR
jgi:hypothetical protein